MESTPDHMKVQVRDLQRRVAHLEDQILQILLRQTATENTLRETARAALQNEILNRDDLDYFAANMGGQ